jgi:hypothetical protein
MVNLEFQMRSFLLDFGIDLGMRIWESSRIMDYWLHEWLPGSYLICSVCFKPPKSRKQPICYFNGWETWKHLECVGQDPELTYLRIRRQNERSGTDGTVQD